MLSLKDSNLLRQACYIDYGPLGNITARFV